MTTQTTLTSDCGPHCATANGHTGHCQTCHSIVAAYRDDMDVHTHRVRETESVCPRCGSANKKSETDKPCADMWHATGLFQTHEKTSTETLDA